MAYETIEYAVENAVGIVRLNRPAKLNAISLQMVREIRALLDAVAKDENVRVLVFTGNGRAFCAGADIAGFSKRTAPGFLGFLEEVQGAYAAIEDLGKPVIAAVNGIAFGGGCELAIACDLRILAEDAKLGVPEIQIGVLPGAGGTQRLPKLLPAAVAKEMIFFGQPLSAEAAFHHGIANAVVANDEVLETALEWAGRLAETAPLALRAAKQLVHLARDTDQKSGVEAERQAVAFLFGTEDGKEGARSFLEKRKVKFTGR
jgi:enoyl-CoA hydratase